MQCTEDLQNLSALRSRMYVSNTNGPRSPPADTGRQGAALSFRGLTIRNPYVSRSSQYLSLWNQLISFTVMSSRSICIPAFSCLKTNNTPLLRHTISFIHQLMDTWVFPSYCIIMNNAARNFMGVYLSPQGLSVIIWGKYAPLDRRIIYNFRVSFLRNLHRISHTMYTFTFPPTVFRIPFSPHPHQILLSFLPNNNPLSAVS